MERDHSFESVFSEIEKRTGKKLVRVPKEAERPQSEYYHEAVDAFGKLAEASEHMKGKNAEQINALINVMDRLLHEDIHEAGIGISDDEDYVSDPNIYKLYQKSLQIVEQYIHENKEVH